MLRWSSQGFKIYCKNEFSQKSKIIQPWIQRHPYERNFHIFYTLIYGLTEPERNRVGLRTAQEYEYLKHSDMSHLAEWDDGRNRFADFRLSCLLDIFFGFFAAFLYQKSINLLIEQTKL